MAAAGIYPLSGMDDDQGALKHRRRAATPSPSPSRSLDGGGASAEEHKEWPRARRAYGCLVRALPQLCCFTLMLVIVLLGGALNALHREHHARGETVAELKRETREKQQTIQKVDREKTELQQRIENLKRENKKEMSQREKIAKEKAEKEAALQEAMRDVTERLAPHIGKESLQVKTYAPTAETYAPTGAGNT